MGKRGELAPDVWAALRWLRALEARGGGYRRRGVRGWALRDEVETGAGVFLWERLPKLWRLELLDREDARAPGRTRPVWLYRITDEGARRVLRAGEPHADVAPPGRAGPEDAAVYLPPGARLALRALRLAAEDGAGRGAWRAGSALLDRLREAAEDGAPVGLSNESLQWLVRAGLAERRTTADGVRGQPLLLWRATAEGLSVPLLEWCDGAVAAAAGGRAFG